MPRESRDAGYLWDMLEAARAIRTYAAGVSVAEYETDRMRQLAVERCVEIMGEAARRLSEEFRAQHAEVPWRLIIGQRNVLAHEYGEIKQERIWNLAQREIPALITALERLLPPPPA